MPPFCSRNEYGTHNGCWMYSHAMGSPQACQSALLCHCYSKEAIQRYKPASSNTQLVEEGQNSAQIAFLTYQSLQGQAALKK